MINGLLREADRYLVGAISARDLETYLASRLQGILDSGDEAAIELANKIDVGLMRLSDEFVTEAEFLQELNEALSGYLTIRVDQTSQLATVTSSTANRTSWGCFEEAKPRVTDLRLKFALG